ncbi:NUDIX hydrolase [Streptococcus pluranimalium]
MDFRTKVNHHSFGVRVSALMLKKDKLYLAKSPKDEYYLLGGAIFVNELSEEAIKREVYEEVGVDIEVEQLAFIVENQFSLEDNDYHQIEFLYLVTPLSEPNPEMEEGGQQRRCEWIHLNDLESINLNPAFLKKALNNWNGKLQHFLNRE